MPGFTHFFRRFFVTEKQTPQTFSLLECMDENDGRPWKGEQTGESPDQKSDLCEATV